VKFVGLFIILAAIWPVSRWLRQNPRDAPKFWMFIGFLPFGGTAFHSYIAIVSWADWPGYVKGIEFSVLDGLAIAGYLSLPRFRHPLPFRVSMALYFVASLISAFQADVPVAALFYPWQLARMFLLYAVVARACADPRVPFAILKGLAFGLMMEACVTIWQRLGLGMLQANGTVDSQNLLGLMSHTVVLPVFALVLAGQSGWLFATVPLAGSIVEVLTTSRATVGIAVCGYAAIFILSALRKWTSRKAQALLIGALIAMVVGPIAASSFDRRFIRDEVYSAIEGYDERAAFEAAAEMMLRENPMGYGANNYVLAVNKYGFNTRAGVAMRWESMAANVHNIYWLIAAETGYPGIITYVLLLLRTLTVAFVCGWRNRGDRRGDLLLGLGVAIAAVSIHNSFEWVYIGFKGQYMFATCLGLVGGLATELGYWRPPDRKSFRTEFDDLSVGPGKVADATGYTKSQPLTR
jgi:hypothetical protein